MATAPRERGFFACYRYGFLFLQNCGSGFKGNPQNDIFAIGDAALNAARAICACAEAIALHIKFIIMVTPRQMHTVKAWANLKTLTGWQRHHRLCQFRFQLIKDRIAQTHRHIPRHTFDNAAHRVTIAANLVNEINHFFRHHRIRTAQNVTFHLI